MVTGRSLTDLDGSIQDVSDGEEEEESKGGAEDQMEEAGKGRLL